MVDFRGKGNLRRLERVVSREVDVKEEHTTLKRAVAGTHDSCLGKKAKISNFTKIVQLSLGLSWILK